MDDINKILDGYHNQTLREIAEANGLGEPLGGKKPSKGEVIARLRTELFSAPRVQQAWTRLGDADRAVVQRLARHGGPVATDILRRELIRAGLATEAPKSTAPRRYTAPYGDAYVGDPRRSDSRVFEDVMARLTLNGFVFTYEADSATYSGVSYKLQFQPGLSLFVPEAVRRHLPAPPASTEAAWQPERVQVGEPDLLLRDLYLYWDFVRRNDVPLIQAGLVGKRSLKAINALLLTPDPLLDQATREDQTAHLYLLRQLLQELGVLQVHGDNILRATESGPAIDPFWGYPRAEQVRASLVAWSEISGPEGRSAGLGMYMPRYAHARAALLEMLRGNPEDAWFEVDDLLTRLQGGEPNFLFLDYSGTLERTHSRYSYASYYQEEARRAIHLMDDTTKQFVSDCLRTLNRLGLVELGFKGEVLQGFRLTTEGRAALQALSGRDKSAVQKATPECREDEGRVVVQPSFQVLAIGPVSLATLAQLDLVAERTRVGPGAFEYHLSRESVYRAQQAGLGTEQIVRFLEQSSGAGLPQNVGRSLAEWGAHHERITFRSGVSLLQAANGELLARLLDAPGAGPHLARAVGPDTALIKPGKEQALIRALAAQGLLPALSDTNPSSADHTVHIDEEGVIRPLHAVPNLHLRGRLSRLAEPMPDGTWRLTPASLQQAGGNRDRVLWALEELGRLQHGSLPERLIERVRTWGGYYGAASLSTLTLIEFIDQTTRDELLRHPDLRRHLTRFPAADRALAIVAPGRIEQVREVLARLGIPLRE